MSGSRPGPFRTAHAIYVGVVGMLSLAGLAVATASYPDLMAAPLTANLWALVTFVILGFLSRLLAFQVADVVTFSLDTSVYVACLLTMGTGPGTFCVFSAMLARGLVELVRREFAAREHWPLWVSAAKLLFGPALTAGIMASIGLAMDPARPFSAAIEGESVGIAVAVFALTAVALIVPQYTIVMVSYALNGLKWRRIFDDVVKPGLAGEFFFLPLGFALAICFKGRDLLALGALAVSYVGFSYIFRRVGIASQRLREHVEELAVIEEAGRAALSLDIEEVGRLVGMSIVRAVEGAAGTVLTVVSAPAGDVVHFVRTAIRGEKLTILGAVLRKLDMPLPMDLVAKLSLTPPPSKGAPLRIGEIVTVPLKGPDGSARGHLSVAIREGFAVRPRDRRILDRIATQAATAVENWRLYTMATEDGLTRLYVRRYLEARLVEEVERSVRLGSSFCLLMIDVDNLKEVNDIHGHAAGDDLLRRVAATIRETVRAMDVPARLGGDEFAVLLVDMERDEALAVAHRVASNIRQKSIDVGGVLVGSSASIGVVDHPRAGARSPADLLDMADQALYAVKKSGKKGRVVAVGESESGLGQR